MSLWNIIDKGYCPPIETRIRAHRLHSCTDIQFDRDLIGLIRLNGNIPPGPHRTFLHTDNAGLIAWKSFTQDDIPAGNDGDYLQTIAGLVQWAPPTFAPSAIAPGTARQLLQTNAGATAAEWTSNVDIPGTLDVTGNTVLDADLNIDGEITLNSVSGALGQTIVSDGVGGQTWSKVPASGITPGTAFQTLQTDSLGTSAVWVYPTYFARYYQNSTINMNSGGTGDTLLKSASVDVANSNISYSAGTFTLAEAGTYQVVFKTNATTVGAGAQSLINLKLNGAFYGSYTTIPLASGVQSVVFPTTFKVNTTNSTVQIISQQLVAGAINTSAADANGIATTTIVITRIGPYVP